jgi:hypothetical protein
MGDRTSLAGMIPLLGGMSLRLPQKKKKKKNQPTKQTNKTKHGRMRWK